MRFTFPDPGKTVDREAGNGKITRALQIWCIFVVVSKDLSGDQLLYLKELAALDEDFGVREDVVNRINAKVDSTP